MSSQTLPLSVKCVFQEFLAKYQFLLKDGDEMECSNLPVTVINFNYKTECEPADHHQLMV